MITDADLAVYRAMTPGERFQLALELTELAWQWLDVPDRSTGDRKWAVWNREHDLSNQNLLKSLGFTGARAATRTDP